MAEVVGRYDFSGRVVAVTGAGRGLGRIVARLFLEAGARVALLSRRASAEAAEEVARFGDRALFHRADLSIPAEVDVAFAAVARRFGPVEILVNNAGVAHGGTVETTTPDAWDDAMANNLRSYFLCIRAVLPAMKDRRVGAIVNVSSVAGRDKSLLLGVAYTASKAGIIGLTRHVAAEAAPFSVRANCVCPSTFHSPMTEARLTPEIEAALRQKIPLGRLARAEEIARVILFLASDDASFMTGAVVDINGGLR